MIESVVNQLEVLVLVSTLGRFHEMQWSLHRLIVHLLAFTRKLLALLLDTLDEEHTMIITRDGEARLRNHHRLMEPSLVCLLQVLRSFCYRIVIEGRRDICIVLIESLQIILGVHQPLCIAEERDRCTRILAVKLIQLVEHGSQLWRTTRIQDYHILLAWQECLGKLVDA